MTSSIFECQPHVRPWTLSESRVLLHDKSSEIELQIADISKGMRSDPSVEAVIDECRWLHICDVQKARRRPGSSEAETGHGDSTENHVQFPVDQVACCTDNVSNRSIFSDRTIAPLNITAPLLEVLFGEYGLTAAFADVVASFGEEPNLAEGRSNNASVRTDKDGFVTVSYQARYVELNGRGGENPWSLRHTGVYHQLKATGETDMVVLLHPVRKPILEQMIARLRDDGARRRELCGSPVQLHEMLYGCYFDNWRWYMRHLGSRVADKNDLAMVTSPDEIEPNSSFDSVQVVRNTNDHVIFARACCAGNKELLDRLHRSSAFLKVCSALDAHSSKLSGYIESADVLERRIHNLIELVSMRTWHLVQGLHLT